MTSEAVARKLEYLNRCLKEGPLQGVEDPEVWELLDFLNADMAATIDEAHALTSHMVRFIETFIRVKKHLAPDQDTALVEVGHLSLLARFMKNCGYNVTPCLGDFRYKLEGAPETADVLFAFEVFEHVKDQDSTFISDIDIFNFSGINRFLQECRRLLKRDGTLVITTPNICSLHSLVNLVEYKNPLTFYPHVKEYSPQDVIDLCARNGMRLVKFEAFFAYYYLGGDRQKAMEQYILKPGFAAENRGDCSFFIFCRDDAPQA
ncbi:MAG TPA: hypothetical protein DDZ81_16360 [Acetobacteraceae bacterium]|jgi:SAM-dependent methyltransferase|nr:hypothetical protein [Acetobacteraceae bacterium]